MEVDYMQHGSALFNQFGLQTVPVLAVWPPSPGGSWPSKELPATKIMNDMHADGMAEFVSGVTGARIQIYRSPWPAIISLLVLSGIALAAVRYAWELLEGVLTWVRGKKWLVYVGALGIFFTSVCGTVFNILRGTPWVGLDRATGKPQIIAPNGTQYIMEGMLAGGSTVVMAAAVIALIELSARQRISVGAGATLALACLAGMAWTTYKGMYRSKSPWYNL